MTYRSSSAIRVASPFPSLGGWFGGGTLKSFDLRPCHLPYSSFDPDPFPLMTLWSGPVLGVFLPIVAALLVRQAWLSFVASFCVLANGVYLFTSWFSGERSLDTPQLLAHGAYPGSIAIYCLLTISVGYLGFRHCCIRVWSGDPVFHLNRVAAGKEHPPGQIKGRQKRGRRS